MNIEDIERLLNEYYVILPPDHIIILDRPAVGISPYLAVYRGLQPKWRPDIIILTPLADEETVLHETLHTYGLGEFGATYGAKILLIKHKILEAFPRLRELRLKIGGKRVHYQLCSGCELCRDIWHTLMLHPPPGAKPKHYYRVYHGQSPTHSECAHYRNGWCTLKNKPVNPTAPACPQFTPRR